MCGILGICSDIIDLNSFNNALSNMSHRGPDNEGVLKISRNLIFGHRRLSIQDLSSSGNQPMQTTCNRFFIVFNGEIYNFLELKKDLINKGYSFFSNSDTEVILYLFKEYGIECVKLLNGDFAFSIFDKLKNELYLVRDRFGIKPLYYSLDNNEFVFSSEIKSLLKASTKKKHKNYQAIYSFLKSGSVPAPLTMFSEVYMLEPSHYLKFSKNRLIKNKYYEYDYTPNNLSYNENLEKIDYHLNLAVKKRLISDLPVGAFLSGGIDSSIVVALMRKYNSGNINTFSIDFDNQKYSEGQIAKLVAQKYNTNHHNFVIQPKDLKDNFYNILDILDSPSIDGVNTFFVTSFTKKQGITVAMSGLGGDEFFGGYPSFENYSKLIKLKNSLNLIPKEFFDLSKKLPLKNKWIKLIDFLSNSRNSLIQPYLSLKELINDDHISKMFKPKYNDIYYDHILDDMQKIDFYSDENLVSYLESRLYMSNQLLRDSDNMSMTNSLELRVPMLDHNLVNHVNSIPGKFKHNKKMLVDSMKYLLPAQVYKRTKKGFAFPFDEWIRSELRNDVRDLFFLENEMFDKKSLENHWKNFENRKINWARVWAVVVINYYNQKYF